MSVCVDKQEKKVKSLTCVCVCVSAHLGPHLSQTLFSCCEGRGVPSQLPITLFKTAEGFCSSSVLACKRTCTPSSSGESSSPHLFTRAANSRRTFTALTNVRGSAEGSGKRCANVGGAFSQAPRNPPQHQDSSNILVPSREPPICIHNPLLVSTRSQHGTRLALQY